ncbi:hypothetical protein MNEG_8572 [Monoraphidium neglectum]|uniref:GDT1 family protein n=1 Tax=Monoraphidium neglectum TaxID=145388 RepID=A0A0D2MZ14_9CHLO|nr:hypothetical protein MNEG_8572 [Monoraphidium neglectum]KIY99390.1 hypothetical protein MNEG_8572 [Monoraphidium neglectum]|eukprot:XP_013898410.1 hypothetical protein MNEG_8572 [Monoraphidium neglectum]
MLQQRAAVSLRASHGAPRIASNPACSGWLPLRRASGSAALQAFQSHAEADLAPTQRPRPLQNASAASLGVTGSSSSGSSSGSSSLSSSTSSLDAGVAAANAGAGTSFSWRQGAALGAALAAAGAVGGAVMAGPALAGELAAVANTVAVKIPGLIGDNQFVEGFVSGFLLIFFSEIGDKTFFIALLLALKEDRSAVFAGTFGALAVMTVISVALGQVFHQLDELLPASGVPFDDLVAVALLLFFGISTLKRRRRGPAPLPGARLRRCRGSLESGLAGRPRAAPRRAGAADADARAAEEKEEAGEVVSSLGVAGTSALVASTFGLVFAAEWGDKSFLATIALAAASDPAGVVAGAVAGHGLATGIAVAGGSVLSKYISERTANYIGGSLFLVFAAATVFDIVTGAHGG